jgi:hypothetical protein
LPIEIFSKEVVHQGEKLVAKGLQLKHRFLLSPFISPPVVLNTGFLRCDANVFVLARQKDPSF